MCYLDWPHFTTASPQVVVDKEETPLSLFETKQTQVPQLFLIRQVL